MKWLQEEHGDLCLHLYRFEKRVRILILFCSNSAANAIRQLKTIKVNEDNKAHNSKGTTHQSFIYITANWNRYDWWIITTQVLQWYIHISKKNNDNTTIVYHQNESYHKPLKKFNVCYSCKHDKRYDRRNEFETIYRKCFSYVSVKKQKALASYSLTRAYLLYQVPRPGNGRSGCIPAAFLFQDRSHVKYNDGPVNGAERQ